jgi:SAM-dependent methyltransferase
MVYASPTDNGVNSYYDSQYFAKQKESGAFGAKANLWLFEQYIRSTDVVVDFGCGGGFLLKAINCRAKFGVEINPVAQGEARQNGLHVVSDLVELDDGCADVIISNHALEHTFDPFAKVKLAFTKLKGNGRAVFVVPCERYDTKYIEQNFDQHLYTWSPVNLGNLFRHAGFSIQSCERMAHLWPPRPVLVQRLVGWPLFHLLSRLNARLRPRLTQVRIVAMKPARS